MSVSALIVQHLLTREEPFGGDCIKRIRANSKNPLSPSLLFFFFFFFLFFLLVLVVCVLERCT